MIHWSRRPGIAPAIIGAAAIFTASGFAGLQARGRELGTTATTIATMATDTHVRLADAGAARHQGVDPGSRRLVEHDLETKWATLEAAAREHGGDIADAARDVHTAMTAFRVAADYESAERDVVAASAELERIANLALEEDGAVRTDARRRAIVTLALEAALLALLLVAVRRDARAAGGAARDSLAGARQARIETLERRIALVSAASVDSSLTQYCRRVVEAIAQESGAPVVVLHVAPIAEPMALEPVAATGVRSVGRTSPPAALEVLTNQVARTLEVPQTNDLAVHTSAVTVHPTHVLLLPILLRQRCIAVVELGVTRASSTEETKSLETLLATVAPALSHLLADDHVHRLSREVRSQAATMAGVTNELDNVFEVLADGLAVTDDDGRIIRLNAAGREILGLGAGTNDGPPSLIDPTNPLLQALGEGNHASGLEVALFNGDEPRIVQVKLAPLSSDPASRAAVAVFRDVSRERHLEHELRAQSGQLEKHVQELELRRQELERATRLKSEFLANMSHELRTPLNAVIGFAEVLLDGTFGPLNPKQAECAGDVLAGGRHLLGLINDVLDLSKIEAAKMELQPEHLAFEDVVAQAITLVRPQASAKKIALDVEVSDGQLWVHADSDRFRQVLVNLLSNAVKFTPNGGRVVVRAELEGDLIRVSVTDNGIGIAKEHANKLFKEFSQIDGSITRRFGGTGLGLAISKRLVEMQGGTIGFTSALGEGSCFFFTVPRSTRLARPTFGAPQLLRRSPSSSLPATRAIKIPKTVLVLDADDAVGRLIEGTLREAGFIPMRAETLAQCRQLAEQQRFEALIVDPVVSDASDAEVLHFATERFGACMVIVSAHQEAERLAATPRAGFVLKPLDRTTLVEQVRAAIARKGPPRHALVVDAIEEDRGAVRGLLEREGFVVHHATSIAEARRLFETQRPVLIVTELDLPDGDGLDFVRPLASIPGLACVVLTAREVTEAGIGELEAVATVVLRKGTLSRSAFARHITAALREAGAPRARILTVDDNEQNLRLLAAMLGKHGFDILEARDASSAVAIARAERPDLILMDVMLPDVDGLTATRELKADVLTRAIPVIAVTANAMAGDAAKAVDAGCCAHVTKPVDARRLLEAIDSALASARGAALRASSRGIVAA